MMSSDMKAMEELSLPPPACESDGKGDEKNDEEGNGKEKEGEENEINKEASKATGGSPEFQKVLNF